MAKEHEIEIPASALEPKPWFKERPGEDIALEIKKYVTETGTPHLWRGHTHTPPPEKRPIEYIEEFDLPSWCKPREKWAPCPCCTPHSAKYIHNGKIAWFPEEAIIRLMGPECYKKLDAKGHKDAYDRMREARKINNDLRYLKKNISIVSELLATIYKARPIASGLDSFRRNLHLAEDGNFVRALWAQLWDGNLKTTATRNVTRVDDNGEETTHTEHSSEIYAQINGQQLLSPTFTFFDPQLEAIRAKLLPIHISAAAIELETPKFRNQAAATLGKQYTQLKTTLEEMKNAQLFFSVITVNTLRTWGARNDANMKLKMKMAGGNMVIGVNKRSPQLIPIEEGTTKTIPLIPSLAETNVGDL